MEHLLRDVKDSTVSTLATEVAHMVTGLKGLKTRLLDIEQYLQLVLSGKLPVNHDIMYQLQARPSRCSEKIPVNGMLCCISGSGVEDRASVSE